MPAIQPRFHSVRWIFPLGFGVFTMSVALLQQTTLRIELFFACVYLGGNRFDRISTTSSAWNRRRP
jgi:hypothetical protein